MPKKEKLKRVNAREAIKAFECFGFEVRRTSGSHFILKKEGVPHLVSIPKHAGDVGVGLIEHHLKSVGLSNSDFNSVVN